MADWEPSGVVALDIEIAEPVSATGGWEFTSRMTPSLSVVCDIAKNRYRLYDHTETDALRACLDRADRIVTWNGWLFDLPVIYGVDRPQWAASEWAARPGGSRPDGPQKPLRERSCDLYRLAYEAQGMDPDLGGLSGWKLKDVCEPTIGVGKIGDGADAPELFRSGQFGKLYTYGLHDVAMLVQLYQFVAKYGFIMNRAGKVIRLRAPRANA